jgi:hypothetical protein
MEFGIEDHWPDWSRCACVGLNGRLGRYEYAVAESGRFFCGVDAISTESPLAIEYSPSGRPRWTESLCPDL